MDKSIENVLAQALSQVGVREVGVNRGERVDAYLRKTGVPLGQPWCAAFVWWCFVRTYESLEGTPPIPRTARCETLRLWAKRQGKLHSTPRRGDLFLILNASGKATHTGFVLATADRLFTTVEGNTNSGGSREGDGVYKRTRTIGARTRFIRWARPV